MAYKRRSPQPVVEGGTGVQANTVYAVLCGGTTTTNPIQSIVSVGTSGQILTSNGAGALPTFQAAPATGITSISGDTGGAQTGPAITFAGGTTGLSFGGSTNTLTTTFAGITANGGTVSLATDATTSTVNIGTGAGAKTVTLGSTNTSSSLALHYGTADFTLASATGTVMSALDTGEITFPLQPAFCAALSATQNNVTGNAMAWININANTEIYDVNSDYNNSTYTFTAPVTGKYYLLISSVIVGCTIASQIGWRIVTSNRTYENQLFRAPSSQNLGIVVGLMADMDAADTAQFFTLSGGEASATNDIYGDGTVGGTFCQGYLLG